MKSNLEIHQSPSITSLQEVPVDSTQGTVGFLRNIRGGVAANEENDTEFSKRVIVRKKSLLITPELTNKLESFNMNDEEIKVLAKLLKSYADDKSLGTFVFESGGQFVINQKVFRLFSIRDIVRGIFSNHYGKTFEVIGSALLKCGALKNSGINSLDSFKELIGKDVKYKVQAISNPPASLEELLSGKENTLNNKKYGNDINDDIILEDGTVTNRSEILFARALNDIGVQRNKEGKLVYSSGEKAGKPFTLEGNVGILVSLMDRVRDQKRNISSVDSTLVTVIPRFFSNLLAKGVINMSDFNLYSTETNYTYLSKPIGSSFQVMLPTQDGKLTAQYYIGRNVYSGTEREIDRDSSIIRVLDYKTGGIFEKSGLNDDLHLLYTFPLIPTELIEERKKLQQEKVESGTKSQAVVTVGGKEMRLTPYSNKESNTDAVFNMRYELLRLGIYSTTIPWEDQVSLYKGLAGGGGRSDRIKKFAKEFGESGIKAFLSYEKNSVVSKIIYDLSEKNPKLAHQVFDKIAQIVDQINQIDLFLENTFGKETNLSNVRAQVRSSLLGKATSVLEAVSDDSYSEVKTLEKLSVINTQTLLFTSSFKSLIESGFVVSLEDIANAELVTHTGETLSREDYGLMFDMYKKNQGANSAINQELILKSFSETAENPKARFHMFKWNNKLQGFVVFQDDKHGFAKGSAFNVDPETIGYKIGDAILNQVIKREAEARPLIADVLALNTIVPKYLNTGWVATRFFIDNTDPVLDIIQDHHSNEMYWGKTATPEAIMSLTAPQKVGRNDVVIEIAHNQKDLIEKYKNNFEKGLCLTRIVRNNTGDMYYGVFEPFIKPEPKIKPTGEDITEESLVE